MKNSIFNLISFIIPALFMFISMGVLSRYLDTEVLGLYVLIVTFLNYGMIFDLGLSQSAIWRLSSKDREESAGEIFTTLLYALLILSIIPSAIIFVSVEQLVDLLNISEGYIYDASLSLKIIAITIPLVTTINLMQSVLEGFSKYKLLMYIRVFNNVLTALMPCFMVLLGIYSLSDLIFAFAITKMFFLLMLIFVFYMEKITLFPGPDLFDKKILLKLFSFGKWIGLSNLINQGLLYSDRFIISSVLGANVVVYYTMALDLVGKMAILPQSIYRVIFTEINGGKKFNEEFYIIIAVLLLIVSGVVFFLSPTIVEIWLGEAYVEKTSNIIQWLLVGFWFNSLSQRPYTELLSKGKTAIISKIHMFEILPYILVLYLAINSFGIVGAAIVWSLRMILDYSLMKYFNNG
ncbi:flippase [Vibrio parahaemolyticus]|nr:flippase [Vibrio parahaemolyticus]